MCRKEFLILAGLISQVGMVYGGEKPNELEFQFGIMRAYQGKAATIAIRDLIGDYFSLASSSDQNGLLGLGYYVDGFDSEFLNLKYGVNAFYLANTTVSGLVYQEMMFDNLSYQYQVAHLPAYVAVKSILKTKDEFQLILNMGFGVNRMTISGFEENSRDGVTQPDQIFSGKTTLALSAMAGIGLKLNNSHLFKKSSLECGYRFFFLGQGRLKKINSEVLDTLSTGDSSVHAMTCSILL